MTAVSVITPAYKAEPFIARAVRSVLAQTHTDWEMIIVSDDGQDYRAFLQGQGISDARLRFASTGKTGAGPGAARNAGIDHAAHALVANLDADDAYAPDFMERILPTVVRHGVATSAFSIIDDQDGNRMPLQNMPRRDMALAFSDMLRFLLAYANIVYDRRKCRARWPEELNYGEDIVFWGMLLDELPVIHYVAGANYYYYIRQGSLSRAHDPEDTAVLGERLRKVSRILEARPDLIRNAHNREFLKRWFELRYELEELFGFKIVAPEVYIAELNKRYDQLFGTS